MGLLNSDKVIVGYDLRNDYTQISFSFSEKGDVSTLPQSSDAEHFNIPTMLAKRHDNGQWLYGVDAKRCGNEETGLVITDLLELAWKGDNIVVDEESVDPVGLLALFFKRSLSRLFQTASVKKISALMITCEQMDYRTLEVLRSLVKDLPVKADRVSFQSHAESFYSYVIHQPKELWAFQSVLFTYQDRTIKTYRLESNRRTSPIVSYIEEKRFDFYRMGPLSEEPGLRAKEIKDYDAAFLHIAESVMANHLISSVYLIGDVFDQEWMKESLTYLCRGRRVFQGNNLFSKGACCGMQERISPSEVGKTHVFLGSDKLKANVGMKLYERGEEKYFALMDAGVNWYEAEVDMNLYLRDGGMISLIITPLNGQDSKVAQITMENFPEGTSLVHLRMYMDTETKLAVIVEDLGLGEFREPSGQIWQEYINI